MIDAVIITAMACG